MVHWRSLRSRYMYVVWSDVTIGSYKVATLGSAILSIIGNFAWRLYIQCEAKDQILKLVMDHIQGYKIPTSLSI